MNKVYSFKVDFKGTIEEFYEFLNNYQAMREYHSNDPFIWIRDIETYRYKTTSNLILLWDKANHRKTLAFIKLQKIPRDRVLLIVHLSLGNWIKYKPYWELLCEELKNQHWIDYEERSYEAELETLVADRALMRRYYPDYNPETANKIINAIPKAWELQQSEGGRWGPGKIGKVVIWNPTTIGRYLKAFKKSGILVIVHKGEKIPIP